MTIFAQCLSFSPSNAQRIAQHLAAGKKFFRAQDYEQAIQEFRLTLPWFPRLLDESMASKYWDMQFHLSMSYYHLGNYWGAMALLDDYCESNKYDLGAYVTLKICQQEVTKQAAAHIQKAEELCATNQAVAALAEIKSFDVFAGYKFMRDSTIGKILLSRVDELRNKIKWLELSSQVINQLEIACALGDAKDRAEALELSLNEIKEFERYLDANMLVMYLQARQLLTESKAAAKVMADQKNKRMFEDLLRAVVSAVQLYDFIIAEEMLEAFFNKQMAGCSGYELFKECLSMKLEEFLEACLMVSTLAAESEARREKRVPEIISNVINALRDRVKSGRLAVDLERDLANVIALEIKARWSILDLRSSIGLEKALVDTIAEWLVTEDQVANFALNSEQKRIIAICVSGNMPKEQRPQMSCGLEQLILSDKPSVSSENSLTLSHPQTPTP